MKAPSVSPVWYGEYERQVVQYAKTYDLTYINYLERLEEVGIDYNTDTYDMGLHMNLSGARKMTSYLGKYLKNHYDFEKHTDEKKLIQDWEEKEKFYDAMERRQEKEVEKYGSVVSY